MKFVILGSVSIAMLVFCGFVFAVGVVSNSDLRHTEEACKVGFTYHQCQTAWKGSKNISVEYDGPSMDVQTKNEYIVILHPRNNSVLHEDSAVALHFTDGRLTYNGYNEVYRYVSKNAL